MMITYCSILEGSAVTERVVCVFAEELTYPVHINKPTVKSGSLLVPWEEYRNVM